MRYLATSDSDCLLPSELTTIRLRYDCVALLSQSVVKQTAICEFEAANQAFFSKGARVLPIASYGKEIQCLILILLPKTT